MPTFSAPLQEKTAEVPSKCDCTCVLGMPRRTLSRVDTVLVKKGRQQSAGKKGIYWALTKCKKGYSKIDEALWSLLVAAFNDHTHVIMLPNANDLLHLKLKNVNGKKVLVCKVLTQASLGTIFSDIIRDNPTIKGKVVERAFRYIVSGLGCVRHFTDSFKQMCGCTKCVGLHTLHCLLLWAKHGVMHRQFAIDAQQFTRKAQAADKARGWGAVAWHPKLSLAIMEGTCTRWSLHAVSHWEWECQQLLCSNCKEYPVPKEEAQEVGAMEDISFHVYDYEYKVSLREYKRE